MLVPLLRRLWMPSQTLERGFFEGIVRSGVTSEEDGRRRWQEVSYCCRACRDANARPGFKSLVDQPSFSF